MCRMKNTFVNKADKLLYMSVKCTTTLRLFFATYFKKQTESCGTFHTHVQ